MSWLTELVHGAADCENVVRMKLFQDALFKIDALVPRDHEIWPDWHAWHARLDYDDNLRAHLPRVCRKLFAPYRMEPWAAILFKQLKLL
jgi:hypothetical protein